eukprot:CAMPEP_0117757264 /NCGR_PEP_ID=MMETSP0947-20121206/14620_1 /TAXON_ID=44440 /ORGANISM="Chattonella subsalsa, Strain CCMP2191" /LENGTH=604 /DNA_ID=CAMNT_0005577109 /DNA_START=68 /DNA_END=1882 /DNA_ORIENTATION=+
MTESLCVDPSFRHTSTPDTVSMVDIEGLQHPTEEHKEHLDILRELVQEILYLESWKEVEKRINIFRKKHKIIPKKNVLYHLYLQQEVRNEKLERVLITKKVRSLSGVLVVTVLTSPHPTYTINGKKKTQRFSCKHNCYYCPNEPAHEGNNFVPQPRSYLHDEPGVLRANQCGFDAVKQFRTRVSDYIANGHPIDKIEILILGGTWSEYPRLYQEEFIRDLYYAANTIFDQSRKERLSLEEEISLNEKTSAKIIGVTLETRPDTIDLDEIQRFRRYGCTRVQIGVQHTDNKVLDKINREHGIEEYVSALKLLKDNCYKVDIHLMPNLPGSCVDMDEQMFEEVLNDPNLQADQWKIYPCSVVPWTIIEKWHKDGSYVPYSDEKLFELILRVKAKVHPWIRLNRVIRDIPNTYITGGCQKTNMRQLLLKELKRRGHVCRCIRCREVKGREFDGAKLKVRKYKASGGWEYFISFESDDEMTLFGFVRLRIPSMQSEILPELKGCALIRELHVYGQLRKVGADGKTQHKGLGKRLLKKAEQIALSHGFFSLAIISGVGVREYYRKHGYQLKGTFMVKHIIGLQKSANIILFTFLAVITCLLCYFFPPYY